MFYENFCQTLAQEAVVGVLGACYGRFVFFLVLGRRFGLGLNAGARVLAADKGVDKGVLRAGGGAVVFGRELLLFLPCEKLGVVGCGVEDEALELCLFLGSA